MSEQAVVGESDVITKVSTESVVTTVGKLTQAVQSRGMHVFAVIDHAAEARQVGLVLRDTTLVIFGSPQAGTPVMAAAPLSALDLPLKVLIWDDDGRTCISYNAPAALAARHRLPDDLASNLSGIDALTDALVGD